MKNKRCKHLGFWEIYKIINFNKDWNNVHCNKCDKKVTIKWKQNKRIKNSKLLTFLVYLLWLSPGFLLMYLVFAGICNFLIATLIITLYHFIAMYLIIKSEKLEIKVK